ncbi:hypothetical protein QKU48_gp1385 [Fadolivirus algeromassiliense]|jgi:hypothetical protein|uniref:Uncharacterized protein n=1 Tax=Fadolivirus FV1/VV64 TaxID=3070911 RepID=A0A7D3QVE5_9VIRU|nr:hypothetical protein QKU48_gp1385 [Fadolivirus algeromassiliense]QKF94843.1 hypothetical protein Fadolivirus_1_1385 [Fadolivirus FV1/VV64]
MNTRNFRAYNSDTNECIGHFHGRVPLQAAKKVFTKLYETKCRESNGTKEMFLGQECSFSIRECTRGSKKRKFDYVGIMKKLDEPIRVRIGHGLYREVKYQYQSSVHKDKKLYINNENILKLK